MKLYKKAYYNLVSLIPEKWIRAIAPVSTLFPYHHTVSDEELLHIKHLYPYKNVAQFRQDLDSLLKLYKPVSAGDINEALIAGKKLPPNSFLLSFDDGFREVYDIIAPILIEKGVPAIFFINPAFLDNQELFYRCKVSLIIEELLRRKDDPVVFKNCAVLFHQKKISTHKELLSTIKKINNLDQYLLDNLAAELTFSFNDYLQSKTPFLTTSQVKELAGKGFSIGAHSWDHPYYNLLPEEEQQRQTINSCRYVKDHFLTSINLFSFPFSDISISQNFFDEMKKVPAQVDIYFGTQNNKCELSNRVIHRFNAERPVLPISKQLKGLLLMLTFQHLIHKYSIKRLKNN